MGIATLLWLTLGNLACSEDAELLSQFEAQVATACMEIPEDRLARLRAVMSAESGTVRGRLVRAMRSWCRENDIPLDPAHQKCISALSKLGIAQNEERLEAERAKREKDRLKKRITREIRATCRSYDAELDDDGILELLQTIGEQRSKGKSFERAFDVLSALCLMKDLGNAEGDTLEERVEDLDSKLATRRLACRQCYEMLLEVVYGPPGPSEKDMIYFARGIIRAALGLSPVSI